jgi:urease accessory protein
MTTTSATKIYAGARQAARMQMTFRLGEGAYLEHFPGPIIPHRGSRYIEQIRVDLAPGGRYVGVQGVTPGRFARGEAFDFELLDLRTSAHTVDGDEICVDRLLLEPRRMAPTRRGLLGKTPYVGSILILAPDRDGEALADALDNSIAAAGASAALPFAAGAIARVLTPTASSLRAALQDGWATARRELLGQAPHPARK